MTTTGILKTFNQRSNSKTHGLHSARARPYDMQIL